MRNDPGWKIKGSLILPEYAQEPDAPIFATTVKGFRPPKRSKKRLPKPGPSIGPEDSEA